MYCAGHSFTESHTIQVLVGSIKHSNRSCWFDNSHLLRVWGEVNKAGLLNEFLSGT